jgi:hypothetical protein
LTDEVCQIRSPGTTAETPQSATKYRAARKANAQAEGTRKSLFYKSIRKSRKGINLSRLKHLSRSMACRQRLTKPARTLARFAQAIDIHENT